MKLFYYYAKPNFGDQLNLLITQSLFGVTTVLTQPYYAKYTMIGSILEPFILKEKTIKNSLKKLLLPPINIYGSGFITDQKHHSEHYIRAIKLHAVRGKVTRDRFSQNLKKDFSDVPLGDPGLLASYLLKNTPQKKYSVGLIAHMSNSDDSKLAIVQKQIPDSILINITDPPTQILNDIASCETIASNAMHGLIVADSLNIPNKRLVMENNLIGGDYKFKDYYSAFNLAIPEYIDVKNNNINSVCSQIRRIKEDYYISKDNVERIKNELKKSAPFKIS